MPTEDILDSKILIVDDEFGVRESMKVLLSNIYQVLTAEDGFKCLSMVDNNEVNLIILDLNMSGMNGLEVLKRIKEKDYSIPVVIVTGVGSNQSAIDALRLGASDFILKPFETHYLREIVKETLLRSEKENDEEERGKIISSLLPLEQISKDEYYGILGKLNNSLETKEPFIKGHAVQVTKYVIAIAKDLGFSEKEIKIMERSSLIHDIGKIGVSEKVITKTGKLSQEEYQEIKTHPEIGTRLLEPLRITHIEYTMILHHHEHYNGKGYPKGMVGEQIPVYARILAVADAFDAMISKRSYHRSISLDQAKGELIENMGRQFDPKIVETFIKILEKNPLIIKE